MQRAIAGEIAPLDWSPDGRRVLLSQFTDARQQLYSYDLDSDTLTRLDHPAGTFKETYFVPSGAIFAQYQAIAFPVLASRMLGDQAAKQRHAVELMARYQQQVANVLAAIPAVTVKLPAAVCASLTVAIAAAELKLPCWRVSGVAAVIVGAVFASLIVSKKVCVVVTPQLSVAPTYTATGPKGRGSVMVITPVVVLTLNVPM